MEDQRRTHTWLSGAVRTDPFVARIARTTVKSFERSEELFFSVSCAVPLLCCLVPRLLADFLGVNSLRLLIIVACGTDICSLLRLPLSLSTIRIASFRKLPSIEQHHRRGENQRLGKLQRWKRPMNRRIAASLPVRGTGTSACSIN